MYIEKLLIILRQISVYCPNIIFTLKLWVHTDKVLSNSMNIFDEQTWVF